jgi:ADP-dependent NAD(P)H-hydrate dehydratase / NAD(P)H-hydrate epimerase
VISAYAVPDVRAAEESAMARLADGLLMQRAASGLAAVIVEVLLERRTGGPGGVYGAPIVLLVGPGNNGGDALWAGSFLARRGARVDAVQAATAVHGPGLAALRAAGGRIHESTTAAASDALAGAAVVVDGLLGIGGRPGLDHRMTRLLKAVPDAAVVVAVDTPSGIDPESGETAGDHIWADVTVTFGVAKPGLLLPPADRAAGLVRVVDIGLTPHLAGLTTAVEQVEPADLAAAWPVPGPTDDKYSRGVVGVVAGGPTYTGAAVLCSGAAVRAGAGMVRYVGPPAPSELVRARWPEVVPGAGRVQAWVLGPGVDPEADAGQRGAVLDALAEGRPCVVDAGALDLLPERIETPTLLTPHAGELARLLSTRTGRSVERGEVEARPLHHARLGVEHTGATVLLKGATCVLVSPDGRVRTAVDGPHWLATAGSGDVLAGLAGVLLAAGLDPIDAGAMAVVVHGLAGERANPGGPVHAEAVLHAIPGVLAALLS